MIPQLLKGYHAAIRDMPHFQEHPQHAELMITAARKHLIDKSDMIPSVEEMKRVANKFAELSEAEGHNLSEGKIRALAVKACSVLG
jgi:hypothetical protein